MGMLSSVDVVEWQSLPHLTQEAWADHTVVNFGVNEIKMTASIALLIEERLSSKLSTFSQPPNPTTARETGSVVAFVLYLD